MLGKIDIGAVVASKSISNAPYLSLGAHKGYGLADGEKIRTA